MAKIEELIKQMCPKGVKYAPLWEIGDFYSGLSGKTKDDFKDGNAKFISYVNIYNNPSLNLNVEDKVKVVEGERQNTIKYGDLLFTGSSETPDECGMCSVLTQHTEEELYLNSFCFGFRFFDLSDKCPSFMKHLFRSDSIRKKIGRSANGVTRYNISKKEFAKIQIPLPPLPIQEAISDILDKFENLSAELQAELQARKLQYEYYRDQLLTRFAPDQPVTEYSLGDLGTLTRGRRFVRDDVRQSGQPCIHYGDMYTYYGLHASETRTFLDRDFPKKMRYAENGDVVIVGAGENDLDIGIGMVWEGDEPAAIHDACYILRHSINPRYISHYLRTTFYHEQIRKYVNSAKICSISAENLAKAKILVPSMEEQARIVAILDKFEALVNDLSQGLPAEIAAVQEQYEYYRNKLLTFDKIA